MPRIRTELLELGKSLALHQAGVLGRQQLLEMGWTHSMIRAQVNAQRWQPLVRSTYLTTTGTPSIESWWWSGHLACGERSYLFGPSALQAWDLAPRQLPAHLGIPAAEQVRVASDRLRISRHRLTAPVRNPRGLPSVAVIEFALIDCTQEIRSPEYVAGLVTDACQRGKTTPGKIGRAMTTYKRLRHRQLLLDLLKEVSGGATSVLEVDAVRLVLKPHGLPHGQAQVRESVAGTTVVRDREYKEYGVVLEFDGRRGHADPRSRLRDLRRDNAVAASGRTTLRFGWADVHDDSCAAAAQIAHVLTSRGWPGDPTPCGPSCVFTAQQRGHFWPL